MAYNNRAYYHIKQGNTGAAQSDLQQAISMRPRYANAHFNLGLVYAITGDSKRMADEFHEAILDNGPLRIWVSENDVKDALALQPNSAALKRALAILQAANRRPGLKNR